MYLVGCGEDGLETASTPKFLIRWLSPLFAACGALVLAGCSASPATAAQKIASCERLHGMQLASGVTRSNSAAAWSGRTRQLIPAMTVLSHAYSNSTDPVYYDSSLQVTLFQSCTWPPTSGTELSGYRQIALTTVPGDLHWPGQVRGDAYADVVDTTCKGVTVDYVRGGHAGPATFSKAVTVAQAGFVNLADPSTAGENPAPFTSLQTWESYMHYAIQAGESVVLHSADESVASARCA